MIAVSGQVFLSDVKETCDRGLLYMSSTKLLINSPCAQEDLAVHDLIKKVLLPAAKETCDRGLMHACYMRLGQLSAAYAVLWSEAEAEKAVHKTDNVQADGYAPKGLGGLLSKFGDEDEHVADLHTDGRSSKQLAGLRSKSGGDDGNGHAVQARGDEHVLGLGVHPCTWWVSDIMKTRPLMLLEARTVGVPKAPRKALLLLAAETLLADGCASLAGQALQEYARESAHGGRARALSMRACLAQLADMIKTEGAQHASTGNNQGALTRVEQALKVYVQIPKIVSRVAFGC